MKLLIVDDEKYIRNSLKNGFDWNSLGFDDVLDASRSTDAIDIISSNNVDIVITDIRMPKLSGIDLIREISRLSPDTKIIIISGYDKFEYAQQALKYGVMDYLLKPAPIEEVVSAVKRAIGSISFEMPEKYKEIIRHNFLMDLIFDKIDDTDAVLTRMKENDLGFLNEPFWLAVFAEKKRTLNSKMLNELAERIRDFFEEKALIFDDNRDHIVVFLPDKYHKDDVLKMCNEVCCDISLNSDFLQAVIGRRITDIKDIAATYAEVVRIADKFVLTDGEYAVLADDINSVKAYNIVYMVKQYVEEHISENITIETITDIIHITPNYFSSIFKRVTGESFIYYVNKQKIQKSEEFLKETNMPVSEIAEKCGFLDVKYFSRVFKKYTDMTPSEYRKTKREGI